MNRNSIDIFNYSIKSEIVAATSSSTYVWIFLRDNQFIVINSANPRIFYKYVVIPKQEKVKNYKIYVSPDEKSCMLVIKGFLYFYSLLTPDEPPKNIKILPNEIPICGTFFEEEEELNFVFCTSEGKVYQLSLATKFTTDLYTTENKKPIYDIKIIQTKSTQNNSIVTTTFVFLFVHDGICIFAGNEQLVFIFNNNNSNQSKKKNMVQIYAGLANSITIDRTSMYDKEVAITWQKGILSCSIIGLTTNNKIMVNQKASSAVMPSEIVAFTLCKYGYFIAKKDSVEFVSETEENPSRLVIPIPGVIKIIVNKDRIWFFTHQRIFYLQIQRFLNHIIGVAQKVKDYDFLLISSPDQNIRVEALNQKALSFKDHMEFAKYLLELDLPFQVIVTAFLDKPFYLISYFELLLDKNCSFSIQIAQWTAILYSQQLPKMKKEFLLFIEKYYKLLSRKMIMGILEKVNFWEGIEKYLTLVKDTQALINQCAIYQKYDILSDLFLKSEDPTQFINIVLSLIKSMNNDENKINSIFYQIIHNKPFIPAQIVPLLFQSADFAIEYINQYFFTLNDIYASITIMFYADDHSEDEIVKIVKDRKSNPYIALRICFQAKCYEASSQILWRLKNPEMAIDYALQNSIETAKNLIVANSKTSSNQKSQNALLKRGWLRLLKKTSGSARRDVMADVIETNLFNFEEITDYVDDEDTILQYQEIMSEAINSIQAASAPIHYRTKFLPIKIPDRPIKLTDKCVLCGSSIIGKKFVIFPCKHMAHSECLMRNATKLRIIDEKTKSDDQYLKSCPVCGFASIPVTTGTIDFK